MKLKNYVVISCISADSNTFFLKNSKDDQGLYICIGLGLQKQSLWKPVLPTFPQLWL